MKRDGDGLINTCGIIGMRHILHVLADMGEIEAAFRFVTSTHHTCYGNWVLNGDSTLRENFKPYGHPTFDSLDHHYLGDIASWMIRKVAGLSCYENIGDRNNCLIKPQFVSYLRYAKARFDSQNGRFYCEWRRTDDGIEIRTSLPKGTNGKIVLPLGYRTANGESEIEVSSCTSCVFVTVDNCEN